MGIDELKLFLEVEQKVKSLGRDYCVFFSLHKNGDVSINLNNIKCWCIIDRPLLLLLLYLDD